MLWLWRFFSLFFTFFIIWLGVLTLFREPDLRFWAVSRYVMRRESLGLDLEKIKKKHIDNMLIVSGALFLAILSVSGWTIP